MKRTVAERAKSAPAKRAAPVAPKRRRSAASPRTKQASARSSGAAASRAAAVRDLERGCDAVLAAIRGLPAEAALRPIAPGRWSPRQIVLHLAFWDEWMLGVLPAAIARDRPAPPLDRSREDAMNAQAVASGASLGWDEVRRLWATNRALLLGLLAAAPSRPAERWGSDHALGLALQGYADHDRHHAEQIRAARRARRAPFAPAFAAQKAGASEKELLLFELQRARTVVHAAIKGMTPAMASRPIGPGRWTPTEIVLHLSERDRVRLVEFDAVLAGTPASWMHMDHGSMGPMNEAHLAPLRPLGWDGAVRLLDANRERLLAALQAVPETPSDVFTREHPFGAMMHELYRHDRYHAEQIKDARIST